MNLEKQLFVKEAVSSFNLLSKNKRLIIIASIIDIFFFFSYGLFSARINEKIISLINNIGQGIIPGIREGKAVINLLFTPEIYPLTKSLLFNLLLLILLIYILYVIFQSIQFWLANNLVKQLMYKNYFIYFAKINVLWILIYTIYQSLDLFGTLKEHFIKVTTLAETTSYWSISANIIAVLLVYFGLISYTKLNVKDSLILGIKKFKNLMPLILSFVVIILVLMFVLTSLFNALITYENGDKIFYIIGAIILFPTLFFLRVYSAVYIRKVK